MKRTRVSEEEAEEAGVPVEERDEVEMQEPTSTQQQDDDDVVIVESEDEAVKYLVTCNIKF